MRRVTLSAHRSHRALLRRSLIGKLICGVQHLFGCHHLAETVKHSPLCDQALNLQDFAVSAVRHRVCGAAIQLGSILGPASCVSDSGEVEQRITQ
jgi:hypothetical protein